MSPIINFFGAERFGFFVNIVPLRYNLFVFKEKTKRIFTLIGAKN